jgi:hypothetical protein
LRRQIRDNLADIARAASTVVGRNVQVLLDELQADAPRPQPDATAVDLPEEDVLERAKKNPTVQSFLKTFPGPVKAEKLKP